MSKRYLTYIVLLSGTEIGLALYLTFWRASFWDIVAAKNIIGFMHELEIFSIVALLICFIAGISGYVVNLYVINWREKLTLVATRVAKTDAENLNQRVQEDCAEYPRLYALLSVGTCKAIAYCLVFGISLVYNFSWSYLIILIAYSLISTYVAKRVAQPLIKLNYDTQKTEASYRNHMKITVNTGIYYKQCISLMRQVAVKLKYLTYFQSFYGQVAVIIPILIVAPAYFNGAMTLGILMQATSTMGTINDNLSFGINSFNDINKLLSCRKRLQEINVI